MNSPYATPFFVLSTKLRALSAAMDAGAQRRSIRFAAAAGVFVVVVLLISLGYARCDCMFKPYDDAYITFRYAYNWASGRGLVFNEGEPTDSASSFLYTLVLAAIYWLGGHDLPRVGTYLGITCAGGIAAIAYLACMKRCHRPVLSAALAIALSAHGLLSGWSVSGMETLPYTLLITLAVYRLFIASSFTWFDMVVLLLIVLMRFEGAIMLAAAGIIWLHHWRKGDPHARRTLLLQAGFLTVGIGVFLVFKYVTYGTLLPHAFHLKQITVLYAPNPGALWWVWKTTALALVVVSGAGLFTLPGRIESLGLLAFVGVSVVSLLTGPSADWARYSVHMLPVAVILACVPLSVLLRSSPVLAVVACLALGWQSYDSFNAVQDTINVGAKHQACRLQVGEFLERQRPAGYVLSSDIGAIAYAAPNVKFIDAVGLTSADVMLARARGESVDPILLAKKPTVIADTCSPGCNRLDLFAVNGWLRSQTYWRTPNPGSTYGQQLKNGRMLNSCKSPDRLKFAAATFELDTR
ncbi:MAG: hypothetical protein ABW321_04215 [Polyangiales bacterium]